MEGKGPRPPPPNNAGSKVARLVQKLQRAPPAKDFSVAPTGPYFFYGTLGDPSLLFSGWTATLGFDRHILRATSASYGVNTQPC